MTRVYPTYAFNVEVAWQEFWIGWRWGTETLYWKAVPWSCWYLEIQPLPMVKFSWWGPNTDLT